MVVRAFQYLPRTGWSVPEFPNLASEKTLVLVFASPDFYHDKTPLDALASHYPKTTLIGYSTASGIFDSAVYDHNISVVVIRFEYTRIKIYSAPGVIITGGLAVDGPAFQHTWLIAKNHIVEHRVLGVGLYGEHLEIGHGSRGGWHIFGPERLITHSEQHVLYEPDNKPALKLYKTYLSDLSKELPAAGLLYPLAIRNPAEPKSHHLVRTIVAIDEDNQALIFGGDPPEGYYSQLMRANFDELIDSTNEASAYLHHRHNANCEPLLAITISRVGRRLLLDERIDEETEITRAAFPDGTIQLGFYSYGELSPLAEGHCELHNQTMTITTFRESKTPR